MGARYVSLEIPRAAYAGSGLRRDEGGGPRNDMDML